MLSSDTIIAPTGHFGFLDFMETTLAMFKKYSSQLSTCAGMSMRGDSASVSSAADKDKVGYLSDISRFATSFRRVSPSPAHAIPKGRTPNRKFQRYGERYEVAKNRVANTRLSPSQ
jgi:hypothetical protein